MRGWLLDTNILSELRKPKPNAKVVGFVAAQPGDLLFTTDVTFGEIRYGIEQLEDPGRRADIRLWLDRTLRPLFAGRVLSITEDVVLRWKAMAVQGQRRGHTFGQPDLFIAAIAALEDLVVVTRDVGEFVAAGGAGARSLVERSARPRRRSSRSKCRRPSKPFSSLVRRKVWLTARGPSAANGHLAAVAVDPHIGPMPCGRRAGPLRGHFSPICLNFWPFRRISGRLSDRSRFC